LHGDEYKRNLPARYKLRKFYLPLEVAEHNAADNCWVSLFNKVFDLTQLIAENSHSTLCDPIVLAAGTDISSWFDDNT
jgi:cytochrome b involved in lipid metabolism